MARGDDRRAHDVLVPGLPAGLTSPRSLDAPSTSRSSPSRRATGLPAVRRDLGLASDAAHGPPPPRRTSRSRAAGRPRSSAPGRRSPTRERLPVRSSTSVARPAARRAGARTASARPGSSSAPRERADRGGELAQRVGQLGRDVLVEVDRAAGAAGEHADVADRQVDLARPRRSRRRPCPACASAAGSSRAVSRPTTSASSSSRPRSSIARPRSSAASTALAVARLRAPRRRRRAPRRARASTGPAASRTIRPGWTGRTSALTASATPPPISASTARANETPPSGGWSVATSAAETAACWANMLPGAEQQRRRSSRARPPGRAATSPMPSSMTSRSATAMPERDAQDDLDGAPAALALREPERDHRRDRGEERVRDARRSRWRAARRSPRRASPGGSRARRCGTRSARVRADSRERSAASSSSGCARSVRLRCGSATAPDASPASAARAYAAADLNHLKLSLRHACGWGQDPGCPAQVALRGCRHPGCATRPAAVQGGPPSVRALAPVPHPHHRAGLRQPVRRAARRGRVRAGRGGDARPGRDRGARADRGPAAPPAAATPSSRDAHAVPLAGRDRRRGDARSPRRPRRPEADPTAAAHRRRPRSRRPQQAQAPAADAPSRRPPPPAPPSRRRRDAAAKAPKLGVDKTRALARPTNPNREQGDRRRLPRRRQARRHASA